jgi:hypothetical protein
MASIFRPTTTADAPALAALMKEVGLLPNAEPEELHWKYWRERPDWPGPRSFVMVRGSEILAHAAIVPGKYRWGSQRITTRHVIDWAARPTASGAGVSLMKYLARATDALLAIGGSTMTLQLLPYLGFQRWGSVTMYTRPLHPLRTLTPGTLSNWTLLPRVARGLLWMVQASSTVAAGWKVRRVSCEEIASLESVFPAPTRDLAILERSAELFRHSLSCPIASMQLYALEHAGAPRGYFLLAFALRQARLVDCWVESENPADWRAMLQCAVREAKRHPRAAELAVWASDATLSRALLDCGFHARGDLPVQVLAPHSPAITAQTLRLQMLDNDAAYRHGGRDEFWA